MNSLRPKTLPRRHFLQSAAALCASLAISARGLGPPGTGEPKRLEPSGATARKETEGAGDVISQLFADVERGDKEAVTDKLEHHPLLRFSSDARDRNLVWIAAEAGHPELFPLVQIAGSRPDIFDCAVTSNVKGINELYQADAAVLNQLNRYGWSPLAAACRCGAAASVETLMGIGAEPNYKMPGGETPLLLALQHPMDESAEWMVEVLLANGAEPNAVLADGSTPLHLAIKRTNEFSVRLLVRKGADWDQVDRGGVSPRALATESGLAPLIELSHGPARLTRDNQEPAARFQAESGQALTVANPAGLPMVLINHFVTAAHFDLEETQRLLRICPDLLLSRASWDELAVEGPTHLGNERNTRFLLEKGSPYSLCTAAMLEDIPAVKRLLAADPRAAQAKGPHDFGVIWYTAFGQPKVDMAELLLNAGADVNANVRGRSVLHEAAARDYAELIEFLIQRGAEVNRRSASTFQLGTPLGVAVRRKRSRAAEVLREHGAVE